MSNKLAFCPELGLMERHLGPTLWLIRNDFLSNGRLHVRPFRDSEANKNSLEWSRLNGNCNEMSLHFPGKPFFLYCPIKKRLVRFELYRCLIVRTLVPWLLIERVSDLTSFTRFIWHSGHNFFPIGEKFKHSRFQTCPKGLERAKCVPNKKLFVQFS